MPQIQAVFRLTDIVFAGIFWYHTDMAAEPNTHEEELPWECSID
jgi:hypothetical protein